MAVFQKYGGAPWLYSHSTGDIVGLKDPDGSEFFFARASATGLFLDTTNQASTTAGAALTFNTPQIQNGVRLVDSSKIYVDRTGLYNWHLSVHVHNDSSNFDYFELWGKLNNADIPNSRFIYSCPAKHGSDVGTIIPSQDFWLPLTAGDYVQIYWSAAIAGISIAYHAAEGSPARPSAPSVLLTINEITQQPV